MFKGRGRVWPALSVAPSPPLEAGIAKHRGLVPKLHQDTSAERKLGRRIIPRPSCNWATHPQTGNPGEGSGSLEILSTPRSENDAENLWERNKSNGMMLISKVEVTDYSTKGLLPMFIFPVEEITYVWPEKNSEHGGLHLVTSPRFVHVTCGLDCEFFKGRLISCTSL